MKTKYLTIIAAALAVGLTNVEARDLHSARVRKGELSIGMTQLEGIGVLPWIAEIQKVDKTLPADDWYRLGFSVSAMREMLNLGKMPSFVPFDERVMVDATYSIYSSRALQLKIKLHLTDQEMAKLFAQDVNRQIKSPLPFP